MSTTTFTVQTSDQGLTLDQQWDQAQPWAEQLSAKVEGITSVSTSVSPCRVLFVVEYDRATLTNIMYWAKTLAIISGELVKFPAERILVQVSKETNVDALVQEFQRGLLSFGLISEIGPAED